jgi:hypothetical protein
MTRTNDATRFNYVVNASVRPVTPLASASVAPVRPARYHGRCADTERNVLKTSSALVQQLSDQGW